MSVPGDERGVGIDDPQQRARGRREALHGALVDLEEALSRPTGSGERWRSRVRAAIEAMHTTLEAHVRDAEGPDGLLAQIIEEEPVFGPRVAAVKGEHRELLEQSEALVERSREGMPPDELRSAGLGLLDRVSRHRHRTADLLYDVYELDLSAGD
jgi:hypothetical protein